jgi:hypothetical protein
MAVKECFSCGKGFNGSVNDLLRQYKREFELYGVERYFYHLGDNKIKICRKNAFKSIFENKVQPNLKNNAEYSHIKEFGNT